MPTASRKQIGAGLLAVYLSASVINDRVDSGAAIDQLTNHACIRRLRRWWGYLLPKLTSFGRLFYVGLA